MKPIQTEINYTRRETHPKAQEVYLAPADENFVTDLVPSQMACVANSPGMTRRTAVWISRDEIVDVLEYDASSTRRHAKSMHNFGVN